MMLKDKLSEKQLVASAYQCLLSNSQLDSSCYVPLLGRCVDLVYIDGDGTVNTVEFKLQDWKRAIAQAEDHLIGSDFSYICMPERKITLEFRDAIIESGVGLYFYRDIDNWPFELIFDAPRSKKTWNIVRENVISFIHNKIEDKTCQIPTIPSMVCI